MNPIKSLKNADLEAVIYWCEHYEPGENDDFGKQLDKAVRVLKREIDHRLFERAARKVRKETGVPMKEARKRLREAMKEKNNG